MHTEGVLEPKYKSRLSQEFANLKGSRTEQESVFLFETVAYVGMANKVVTSNIKLF